MMQNNVKSNQDQAGYENSNQVQGSTRQNDTDMMGCCGSMMAEMPQGCSCGTIMKKHKTVFCLIFLLLILMFLVSQAGGILGILAFFRTF